MTDQQINEVIAELCPSVCHMNDEGDYVWNGDGPRRFFVPCSDLNAMNKAESTLTDQQQTDYSDAMMHAFMYTIDSTDEDGNACIPEVGCNYFGMIHATARQRAEAFLRALGKWKEDKR